jgi:mono/diheme cytochrome c family protein
MPVFSRAHGGPLTDLQIDQIVTYVRTWQTEPAIELAPYSARGDPVAGRLLYHQHCATCHGADGWGVDAPRLASQTFQSTASDAFIRQTIRSGRPGSSMAATALSEPQLADLITFIRTLADAPPTP